MDSYMDAPSEVTNKTEFKTQAYKLSMHIMG